jgi:predicted lipoprotein with Yx(FWY)xxD motif
MTRSRPTHFLAGAVVIPLTALAVAACGGGGAATASPPPAPAKATTTPTQTATVRVANSRLGRILVDSTGHTLYLFKGDSGASSACSGPCAVAWPPLRTGASRAVAAGASAALLGTIPRSDGARQVTYDGHPLYTFVKDRKPGEVNGQGLTAFGAAWFAVSSAGHEISSHPTGHGSGSSSSHPVATDAAPAAKRQAAPKAVPQPALKSTPKSAPPVAQPAPPVAKAAPPVAKPAPPVAKPAPPVAKPAPPVAQPAPPPNDGIPQNNGGDGDSDNNGGPSDGDGNI